MKPEEVIIETEGVNLYDGEEIEEELLIDELEAEAIRVEQDKNMKTYEPQRRTTETPKT